MGKMKGVESHFQMSDTSPGSELHKNTGFPNFVIAHIASRVKKVQIIEI